MIEVIASPDARRIELSGRAAAQGAVGLALYSRSRGVVVSATNLPTPADGHIFQVWATTATGSVSLGLAAPDAHGRMASVLRATARSDGFDSRVLDDAGARRWQQQPRGGSAVELTLFINCATAAASFLYL